MVELPTNADVMEAFVSQIELQYDMCLGASSGSRSDLYRFMTAPPELGDLVLVTHVGNAPVWNCIGWLVEVADVPCRLPDEDEFRVPLDRMWTIMRLDGSGLFTWYNVALLRVPRRRGFAEASVYHCDGVAETFHRLVRSHEGGVQCVQSMK